MTPSSRPAHQGPYTQLTAEAASDLRRPIAADEVRFKVQAVRWTQRDGQERAATAAQVVAYMDARSVIARLNLLFPGCWEAHTDALPLDMRLTRRNGDGTLTPIRITDQGEVKADHTLYYRCRLTIAGAPFEDVGAGDDPKAAHSDAIKRAAVRAGIGESLYAMDSPWLRVGDADHQLRINRAGKPYLDDRTSRWLHRMYQAWLTRAGSTFGEPLPHGPARALPGTGNTPPDDPSATGTGTHADARDSTAGPNLAAASSPESREIPESRSPVPDADPAGPKQGGDDRPQPAAEPDADDPSPNAAHVGETVRQLIAVAHATGTTPKTLKRLAVLLGGRTPDTALKLEDLDDKLAADLARRVAQAHNAGLRNDTLADMVDKALRSQRHRTPAQRRTAFGDGLDRLATEARASREPAAGAKAA